MKTRLQPTNGFNRLAVTLALAAMSSLPATAQTWDGGDANSYWTNALNWVGDVVPAQDSAIVFNNAGAPNLNNTLGQSFGVKSLTFGPAQTTPVTINFTDGTNESLTFNPGTAVTVNAGSHRIVGPALGAATFGGIIFYNAGLPVLNVAQVGNVLTLSWPAASAHYRLQAQTNGLASGGWFDYPGGGSSPVNVTIDPGNPTVFYRLASSGIFYTFDVATGASLELAGRLRQLGSAGTRNYYKTGEGTLWLSADNGGNSGWLGPGDTFTVNQGMLNLGNRARGNSGMKFVVNPGGTLRASGDLATPNGTCTLAGNGVSGNGAFEFAPSTAAAPTGLKLDTSLLILSANASIGVEAGTNGAVNKCGLMGAFTMTKVGLGLLELGSIITNTTWAGIVVSNGTLKVSGAITNPTTAATVANGGTLRVDGSFSRYDGSVTVQSGGKLEGATPIGINGPVIVDGELAPGVGSITPGTLTINNSLTLGAGSTTTVQVAALSNDQVVGLTSVNFGGTLNVTDISLGGITSGQTFQLFAATSYNGNFTSVTGTPSIGGTWSFNPATGVLTHVP